MDTPIDPSSQEAREAQAQSDQSKRAITSATAFMMLGILLSRLLGFVRDRLIAHKFGQGFDTDVYNAAFTIPDLFFFLMAGGALSGAFIPVFSEYITLKKERDAWRIFSAIAAIMTGAFVIATLLGMIFTPQLVLWTNPGYGDDPVKIAKTVALTRILLPAQICFMLGGLMMGTLNARNLFAGQVWGPVIYNAGIILGGLFLEPLVGVTGLCWGALGGAIIGNLLLQWVLVRRSGGYFVLRSLRRNLKHPGVRKFGKLMIPVIFGLSLPYVSTIIGKGFAAALNNGDQTAFMNANRLMQLPLGVFAQAGAIAIFPTLSALAAKKQYRELRHTLCFGLRSVLFLTIPSSCLMGVLALPIVQLLLQSGKFAGSDAETTAQVLVWFAIGIFAWSAHSIITRGYYALQEGYVPIAVGTIVSLLFIPLNFPLRERMGVNGLALATTIAAILHAVLMFLLLRRRLKGLEDRVLFTAVGRITLASGLATLVCYTLRLLLEETLLSFALPVWAKSGTILTLCLGAGIAVYGGLAVSWKMEEIRPVQQKLRKMLGRFAK